MSVGRVVDTGAVGNPGVTCGSGDIVGDERVDREVAVGEDVAVGSTAVGNVWVGDSGAFWANTSLPSKPSSTLY